MRSFWLKKHFFVCLLIIVAATIMLAKLGKPALWQDEAESALLAKSIVEKGYPRAWDGINLITQLSGNDSNENYTWSFTPWLSFYVIAGSFKVLGESAFAGRLPFVIIGILALLSLYLFVYQLTRNRYLAFLSSLFLLLNFQFILYSRQCKYYSILFLIPPILFLAYAEIHQRFSRFLLFAICAIVLFHTNYLSLFTLMIGLILYTFIAERNKRHIYSFILAGIATLVFTIPFFMVGDFGTSSSLLTWLPTIPEYFDKLARHIWYFNNMVFGLVLFLPLAVFYKKGFFDATEKGVIRFFLWIIIPAWLVLPLFNQDVFRYNLHLISLFSVLAALLVLAFFRWSRFWGAVFLLLFISTNIFSNFPGVILKSYLKTSSTIFADKTDWFAKTFNKDEYKTRKYLEKVDRNIEELTFRNILTHDVLKAEYAAYYNELTKDYPDAISSTVNFLKAHAKDGDVVYANFDLLPLMFYLPNLKYGYQVDLTKMVNPKTLPMPSYVTSLDGVVWYFFRDNKMNLGPYVTNNEFFEAVSSGAKEIVPFDLGVSSLYWDITWPQRYYQYINKLLWRGTRDYANIVIYEIIAK